MRIFVVLLFVLSVMHANTTVNLKKGWQLIGVPSTLNDMSVFNTKSVEIVWGYDGVTQSWNGYAPDAELQGIITEKGFATLDSLQPWQAVWVFSKEQWSLDFKESALLSSAKNSEIKLYEGWNLVEIPQNSVVSDEFFGDAVVWKYSSDQEWKVNDESLSFPPIEAITSSEGLWVKSETAQTIDVDSRLSKLQTFNDKASMLEYIRKMITMNNYYYYGGGIIEPMAVPEAALDAAVPTAAEVSSGDEASNEESAKDATSTNLQEEGVDESDIMKHDGTHIFNVDNRNNKIIVTSFSNIAQQNYTPIAEIAMSEKNVIAMFLQNNRLSVISNKSYNYDYPVKPMEEDTGIVNDEESVRSMPYYYSEPLFTLDVFDVSNINSITIIASHEIDGSYQDSRLIDGRLFLISQFYPRVEYEYPKLYLATVCTDLDQNEIYGYCSGSIEDQLVPACLPEEDCPKPEIEEYEESCEYSSNYQAWKDNNCYQYNYDANGAWKYDYDNPIVISEDLTPTITSDGTVSDLVAPSKFYAPLKLDQSANITSISSFSVDSGARSETISFLGNTHTNYASTTSLYLVSSEYPRYYDYERYKEQQMIYKFSLGETMAYEGRGFVEGRMLNQFSMSEKDDYLRVATTSGWSWWGSGGTTNSVYTLKNSDEVLEVKGTLEGLGHENETIRAVRFMGDRGFVVTFEQTDPLYTLDMSDPENPKAVGELEIPGFSTYLHVIDENRVLSIGRNADAEGRQQELQFQLFDITNFAAPRLADKMQIGDKYTYSEAEHNHKAFAYRGSDLMFGVPYRTYNYSEYKNQSENFGIYEVDGMSINKLHTITSSGSDWGNTDRGLIFDYGSSTYGALLKGSNIICETVK
ncbi:MAG: beta-propeller domain-containing protein [Campylobacterota bacterium]|nr:beta-propeller domain-containing protein [Campylobacterota bacterium]